MGPALLGASEAHRSLPGPGFVAALGVLGPKASPASTSRQAVPGRGDFCGDEEHSAGVGARSALRELTRRYCLNVAPAGREVSYRRDPGASTAVESDRRADRRSMSPWQVPPGAMRRTCEGAVARLRPQCAATSRAVGDDLSRSQSSVVWCFVRIPVLISRRRRCSRRRDAWPSSGVRCRCDGRPTHARAPAHGPENAAASRCARAGPAAGSACRWTSSSAPRRLRRRAHRSCRAGS